MAFSWGRNGFLHAGTLVLLNFWSSDNRDQNLSSMLIFCLFRENIVTFVFFFFFEIHEN